MPALTLIVYGGGSKYRPCAAIFARVRTMITLHCFNKTKNFNQNKEAKTETWPILPPPLILVSIRLRLIHKISTFTE